MRIAVITGGMGGFGDSISAKMHAAGYRVVVTHSPGNTKAKEWISEHKASGRELSAYPVDVADFDSCKECVARIAKEVGPVDILVNNAGITRDTTFKKMSKGDWDSVIRTNLDSVFNMTKQVMDGMGRPRLGPCRQRILGEWLEGGIRTNQLFSREGRDARLHQGIGARGCTQRGYGQYHLARVHRHQDGHGDPEGSARY